MQTDHVAFYGTDVGSLSKISIHHYSDGWLISLSLLKCFYESLDFNYFTTSCIISMTHKIKLKKTKSIKSILKFFCSINFIKLQISK